MAANRPTHETPSTSSRDTAADVDGFVFHAARVVAKAGREEELRARLREVAEASRGEPGALVYRWFEVVADDASRRREFRSWEHWASQDALDRHLQQPHFRRFFEREKNDPVMENADDTTLRRVS